MDDRRMTESIVAALERLDGVLTEAVRRAREVYGPDAAGDPFRGLHVGSADIDGLLSRRPGGLLFGPLGAQGFALAGPSTKDGPLAALASRCDLTPFDVDVIVIALAPEADLRYERIYGYLQDDVTKRRPTVELAQNLLCSSLEEKLTTRRRFAPDGALARNGLITLASDPAQAHPSLLTQYLRPDELVIRRLLGDEGLDPRLAACAERVAAPRSGDDVPRGAAAEHALTASARQVREADVAVKLYLEGAEGIGKRRAAEAFAAACGRALLVADMRALSAVPDPSATLRILFREASFSGDVLCLDGFDRLAARHDSPEYGYALACIAAAATPVVALGVAPFTPPARVVTGMVPVPFAPLSVEQRRGCWARSVASAGAVAETSAIDSVAARFRLTPVQIGEAARRAVTRASWSQPADGLVAVGGPDLFSAARAQSGQRLAELAERFPCRASWNDIVLADDTAMQIRELCSRIVHRDRVLGAWGFERALSQGKGVTALFAGPSGTGKTMAAEVVSNELGLDLYRVNLAGVVSKYIGETEKNLEAIFAAAEGANGILFFDEADALFGKRSEVHDAHDRYANVEISYLLQRMDRFDGVAILATNLRQNIEEAFVRRLAFTIHFPFPDAPTRLRIWRTVWPADTPLDADVDLEFLATQFRLSGGNIKNIALAAAFLAAGGRQAVALRDVLHATAREYQKLGKTLSRAELYGSRAIAPDGPGSRVPALVADAG